MEDDLFDIFGILIFTEREVGSSLTNVLNLPLETYNEHRDDSKFTYKSNEEEDV